VGFGGAILVGFSLGIEIGEDMMLKDFGGIGEGSLLVVFGLGFGIGEGVDFGEISEDSGVVNFGAGSEIGEYLKLVNSHGG
jgi:hypothetical protein